MNITLTGASGFIGSRLQSLLLAEGHSLRVLSRSGTGPLAWNPASAPPSPEAFASADAVIHLAGEPVAQRWSPEVKRRIRDSRILGTRHLVDTLATLEQRPSVLVSASAVGYYGSRGDEILTEDSPPGKGFLPDTCVEWEREASRASSLGIRVVQLRIGVVLGHGGALQQMLPPFRAGLGGPIAGGRMWMPWIHLDDLCGLIGFCLQNDAVSGPLNAASPHPVRNSEFTAALGVALHRPAFFPVPGFALRLLYGEMAEVVLGSQRVQPNRTLASGFRFSFGDIDKALLAILRPKV